jgi:type II restriction/modification system DNA methylase subunit YeeA
VAERDVIIGNSPFLGNKKMIRELSESYTENLRQAYKGRVPAGADLVIYWFEKTLSQTKKGHCRAAGLVGTQSIRKGATRFVLDQIAFWGWRRGPGYARCR